VSFAIDVAPRFRLQRAERQGAVGEEDLVEFFYVEGPPQAAFGELPQLA
jgi:hypothetical protein